MAKKHKSDQGQIALLEPQLATAPCVARIREAVDAWRGFKLVAGMKPPWPKKGYRGVTPTTEALLRHWFYTDHRRSNGRWFRYHHSQQAAAEALIYLYEVAGVRRQKDLLQGFATRSDLRLLREDDFARYCFKMATGSGKTKVMALAVAWQFFNAVAESREDFAKTFLLIAPNVIVYERLKKDFAGGAIFRSDPVIPDELAVYWEFQCYMKGEADRGSSQGALYMANVQQFYEPSEAASGEPPEMEAVLGRKPPTALAEAEDFAARVVARGGPVVVLNDEAHHTHDEESQWNQVIRRLHKRVEGGLAAQLDFTATPRHAGGQLFAWTVCDYPLKQAIIDNVVKRPIKGIAKDIKEMKSTVASTRYQPYLAAGVERWREYVEQLKPLKKKPALFVMMNDTKEADDVGDWLRKRYPAEFGGEKLLVIHTDRSGEISQKDLDKARQTAREVDKEESPVNCIVSVLMLREGWDVENVTVVVGLRPFTAKANILPEQTIGRGLRLMFRGQGTGYIERVDVIGNDKFIEFIEELEHEEDMQLDTFEVGKDRLQIVTIQPDPKKKEADIALPVLSPILSRKKSLTEEIAGLDVMKLESPKLPRSQDDVSALTFRYEGFDIITQEKLVDRKFRIPEPQTAEEVVGYYAQRIAQEVKLPSQFAALVPKVREFLERKAFGETVDINPPAMVKAISSTVAQYVTVGTFTKTLRGLAVDKLQPQLVHAGRRLSETPPFPWSRPVLPARKCVFNLVPCDNEFEKEFAKFLQRADDVVRFAKLPEAFGFAIEYTDNAGNLRYYEPDFAAVTTDGNHYLVETKGREDTDVANKDRAATLWCENASLLTQTPWAYVKVLQKDFEGMVPQEFADVLVLGHELLA